MKLFPSSAVQQLEFDKIQALLASHCRTEFAKYKAKIFEFIQRKNLLNRN